MAIDFIKEKNNDRNQENPAKTRPSHYQHGFLRGKNRLGKLHRQTVPVHRFDLQRTWVDADGNVLGRIPAEGTDYSVTYNTVSAVTGEKQWFKGTDGFFYYSSPVVSGSTENLINECKPLVNPEAGYHLKVEIVSQVIQALGSTDADSTPAVVDAWGVTLNSDNLITASK